MTASVETEKADEPEQSFFSDAFKNALKDALERQASILDAIPSEPVVDVRQAPAPASYSPKRKVAYNWREQFANDDGGPVTGGNGTGSADGQPQYQPRYNSEPSHAVYQPRITADPMFPMTAQQELARTPYLDLPKISAMEELLLTALQTSRATVRQLVIMETELEAAIAREKKQLERIEFAIEKARTDAAYYRSLETLVNRLDV